MLECPVAGPVDAERGGELPELEPVGVADPAAGDGLLEVGELIECCPRE